VNNDSGRRSSWDPDAHSACVAAGASETPFWGTLDICDGEIVPPLRRVSGAPPNTALPHTALPHFLLTAERIGLHDDSSVRAFEIESMGVDHLPRAIDLVVGAAERAELEAKLAAALGSKPAPASRRQRRPLIDAEITRAEKAGKNVAAASISPDGTLSLTFERLPNSNGAINPETPEDLRKLL
jgi:hypothetical protein